MSAAKTSRLGLALAALLSAPWPSGAHNADIDPYGCHADDRAGGYHCHLGTFAGLSFRSRRDLLDAVDYRRNARYSLPAEPQVAPAVFDALTSCSLADTDEQQRACFERIAPPRE
jgi:hypothetical protein